MGRRFALGLAALCLASLRRARRPADIGCDAFVDKLRAGAGDLGVDFSHALVVSRARSDTDVFDISTKSEIDGDADLPQGDQLVRFEARMSGAGARACGRTSSSVSQAAAMQGGARLGRAPRAESDCAGDERRGARISRRLAPARRRLYRRQDREHEPGGISLGLIFTDIDRAFIIVGADD